MQLISTFKIIFCSLICVSSAWALAAAPVPFDTKYEIKFVAGFKADAELSLIITEPDHYTIDSYAKLRLLGTTVTTVKVKGDFIWQDENIRPETYEYSQTGVGRRDRTIDYDWEKASANTVVKGKEKELPLAETMFDELSMYIEIQQQAAAGVENIYLNVIDEDQLKEYHYRLLGEELLETDLGSFNTLKYERVRDTNKRTTFLWLAKDWHNLVVRISQKTPVRTFQINFVEGTVDGKNVSALD